MAKVLKYNGDYTDIEYSEEDMKNFGCLEDFESDSETLHPEMIEDIFSVFCDAVYDYLQYCKQIGKIPQEPSRIKNNYDNH